MDASRGHPVAGRRSLPFDRLALPQPTAHDESPEDEGQAPQDSYREDRPEGAAELDDQEEESEGLRQERELLERYPLWRCAETTARLTQLWQAVAPLSRRLEIDYRFEALDSDVPFASSCAHGTVFFSRALLDNLQPDSQLFFAAHEMAHTELRHFATRKARLDDLRRAIPAAPGSVVRQRMELAAVLAVRHQEEFEADLQAARWTSEEIAAGALLELHAVCQRLCPESLNRPTHPAFPDRLSRIDTMKAQSPLEYLWSLLF